MFHARSCYSVNYYPKAKANFSNFLIFLSARGNPLSPESVIPFLLKRINELESKIEEVAKRIQKKNRIYVFYEEEQIFGT